MLNSTQFCRRAFQFGAALALTLGAIGLAPRPMTAQTDKKEIKERILFVSDRDKAGEYAIFAMNPDGSEQVRLSKDEGIHFDPTWSPDHKRILFCRVTSVNKRATSLCLINGDASAPVVLKTGEEQTVYMAPAWSPDGKHIAYSAMHLGEGAVTSSIYIMGSDGKNNRKVVDGIIPVWSPDGKRLIYSPIPAEKIPELKSVDVDGTNNKTVAKVGLCPAWSPDGKRIAYTSDAGDRPNIFVMDSDGTHASQLTRDDDSAATGPMWTSDGKHILFTQIPKDNKMQICLMDADGSNVKIVAKATSFLGAGTSIVFILRAVRK
jgi:Tol biopolymer transport system component